jgi:nucleoside-triphosphatase THEP1
MTVRAPLVVVTGPSGVGKSTVCRRVVDLARSRGVTAGGVITERRTESERGAGLDVVDVATDERRPLAEWDHPTLGPSTGRWHFHPAGLAFGLAGCRRVGPDDLFVIDELGPLELIQLDGWALAMPLVHTHTGPVLVVVRPALVARFLATAEDRHPDIVEVAPAGRDTFPPVVYARLGLGP